ncbi:MAG: hypothetical protein ACRCXC_09285 [Legionella sp.]
MERLKEKSELFNFEYLRLLEETDYLVQVQQDLEHHIHKTAASQSLESIAAQIVYDLSNLPIGNKILIPGGWCDEDGGHAMVYQFECTAEGYHFTVFNAGDGIQYHAKKSLPHKELFNPQKTWFFPMHDPDKGDTEVRYFIEKLLQAMVPNKDPKRKAMTEDVLYQEILPSISYIDGVEIDVSKSCPDHAYTGGQLSGTCAQRCIHQMLKINSHSQEEYQRFIFKFKLHALFDYADSCLSGKQPFNKSVAEQIALAIDNDIKIVHTPGLFTPSESDSYFYALKSLKQRVKKANHDKKSFHPSLSNRRPQLTLRDSSLTNVSFANASHSSVVLPSLMELKNGINLNSNLQKAIFDIKNIQDPATRYFYLEALILSLPVNRFTNVFDPFYDELNDVEW